MENAAEALRIAGFTLLFVTALSIAMITVMQGKNTSEQIISYSDKSKYYSYVEEDTSNITDSKGDRIVKINDIVPTLYRYRSEQYIVVFENIEPIYKIDPNSKEKFTKDITYLNYNLEDKLEASWRNNEKVHVDSIVKNLMKDYADAKFVESLSTTSDVYYNNAGEVVEDNNTSDEDNNEKQQEIRVITYTKQ